jgi:hypothetical protein
MEDSEYLNSLGSTIHKETESLEDQWRDDRTGFRSFNRPCGGDDYDDDKVYSKLEDTFSPMKQNKTEAEFFKFTIQRNKHCPLLKS